ncbi:MAG: hypothetical protein ACI90V_012204, partial [Bacillariaceae sp.]
DNTIRVLFSTHKMKHAREINLSNTSTVFMYIYIIKLYLRNNNKWYL